MQIKKTTYECFALDELRGQKSLRRIALQENQGTDTAHDILYFSLFKNYAFLNIHRYKEQNVINIILVFCLHP